METVVLACVALRVWHVLRQQRKKSIGTVCGNVCHFLKIWHTLPQAADPLRLISFIQEGVAAKPSSAWLQSRTGS
jgi:hypothetical protein